MSEVNYQEILENVNDTVRNLKVNDIQKLNELSSYLIITKQPLVLAKEDSIEFYTYCAIQNLSLCVDQCRDDYLDKKITLEEIEDKIKQTWDKDYNKF
ncbi:hypothetical protein [uncultured Clostridium sp.]|uniref:hypothetical protein n=1 Tax=uncultured Clostridium sp. TaxID=59620 RepID=UPI002618ACE3|nr:hypothetical protein [uncultured Clostridium sp.]MCI8310108.1 hypothetical protein [Clostridia bacterium]